MDEIFEHIEIKNPELRQCFLDLINISMYAKTQKERNDVLIGLYYWWEKWIKESETTLILDYKTMLTDLDMHGETFSREEMERDIERDSKDLALESVQTSVCKEFNEMGNLEALPSDLKTELKIGERYYRITFAYVCIGNTQIQTRKEREIKNFIREQCQ